MPHRRACGEGSLQIDPFEARRLQQAENSCSPLSLEGVSGAGGLEIPRHVFRRRDQHLNSAALESILQNSESSPQTDRFMTSSLVVSVLARFSQKTRQLSPTPRLSSQVQELDLLLQELTAPV